MLEDQDTATYSHIDDHLVMGNAAKVVEQRAQKWATAIEDTGFVVKDPPVQRVPDKYLGFTVRARPAQWRVPARKLIQAERVLLFACSAQGLPVRAMQALVGVCVWLLLLKHPVLSILLHIFLRPGKACRTHVDAS